MNSRVCTVAPLHMVVVEEASTDSNERLKSSVEKGEPLWRALLVLSRLGLHAAWLGRGIVCVWRCDEWVAGGGLGVLGVLGGV